MTDSIAVPQPEDDGEGDWKLVGTAANERSVFYTWGRNFTGKLKGKGRRRR